jgi:glutamine amidotransferase
MPASNKPFLGICIGQQMLFEHSEEGDVPGLGIIGGTVSRFPAARMIDTPPASASRCRTWAGMRYARPQRTPSGKNITDGARFYFVHSYFVDSD